MIARGCAGKATVPVYSPVPAGSLVFARPEAYLEAMLTIIPLVRFRILSGSLLNHTLPRAEAVAC